MADKVKEILEKVKAWWNKYTSRQKSIIIGAAAVVVFTFAILIYVFTKPQYETLVTCETAADAAEVVEILDGAGITYQDSEGGLVINVPTEMLSSAKWALGSSGVLPDDYPTLTEYLSGGMSTTASDKEKFYKEYMEKKLEKDLAEMSNIKSAKVNLDIPQQNGTLLAEQQECSAFIQLELDGTFTSAHAANVAKAVATYLGNDTTANITILDYDSNLLFAGGDDYSTAGIASSMQELQNQAESMVANQVKKVLLGTKQFDNIEVTSHLSMDFSEYQKSVHEYYANPDREEGMKAHEELFESENESGSGGTPGTDSNDENSYMFQDSQDSSSTQTETLVDYLPNESMENWVTPAGGIEYRDSSIAIAAISYREIYEEDVKNQGLLDGISWEEYKNANGSDIKLEVDAEFYTMVANATGVSEDKITIIAYESPIFYDKEAVDISWTTIASVVTFLIILGLLAFVVFRSMSTRNNGEEEEELSVENLLQSTQDEELVDIDVEAKSEIRKVIEKFVDDNPEAAAALLRNWLNEDWS
uniref:flagellar M-ring protein FliF C-terminal domain-containing protein n=1 Tax=Acetatifactor sp. TaxID=1872090 RepID=UPI0040572DED